MFWGIRRRMTSPREDCSLLRPSGDSRRGWMGAVLLVSIDPCRFLEKCGSEVGG